MPFFHESVFHLFYLLDENHHQGKNGLGGHQWAHATSADLVQWEHHPLALGIDQDWEGSICTGSVFYHNQTYYAFYATRTLDRSEHLSLALSSDGVVFEKTRPRLPASSKRLPLRTGGGLGWPIWPRARIIKITAHFNTPEMLSSAKSFSSQMAAWGPASRQR